VIVRNKKREQAGVERGRTPSQWGRLATQWVCLTWMPLQLNITRTKMVSS